MACLTDNKTLILHLLLGFDLLLYLAYLPAAMLRWKFMTRVVGVTIDANIFFFFFLSLLNALGQDVGWTLYAGGILIGAGIGIMQVMIAVRGTVSVCYEFLLTAVLLMMAQLANTYLPEMLVAQYGISLAAATILTLLVPVVLLYAMRGIISSDFIKTFVRCLAMGLLATLGLVVWYNVPSPFDAVCCDLQSNNCPLYFSTWTIIIFVSLSIIQMWVSATVTAVLYVRRLKRECYRCCCFCCCPQQKQRANDNDEEEDEVAPQATTTAPVTAREQPRYTANTDKTSDSEDASLLVSSPSPPTSSNSDTSELRDRSQNPFYIHTNKSTEDIQLN